MKEVSKKEFKEAYFKYSQGSSGYDLDYWNKFFEGVENRPMKYFVSVPETDKHTRMTIASDYASNEYRLFFMTEDDEEILYSNLE
jgi:hypothetical protein